MKKNYQNDEFLRKRKERQRKQRKRRLKIFFVFFVVVLLIIGVVLSLTVLFPIKQITAKGSKYYSGAEIVSASQIEVGDNLFAISKKGTLENLRKKLPFVQDIEFKHTLPDTLHIRVTDAKEFTCHKISNKYFTVGADGWVLKSYKEKPENVIEIICQKVKCEIGSSVEYDNENSQETIMQIIENLQKNNISVQSVDVTDKLNLKAEINRRFTVVFGSLENLESKIKHLESMMEKIPENKGGKIDLSMWNSQNTQGIFVEGSAE